MFFHDVAKPRVFMFFFAPYFWRFVDLSLKLCTFMCFFFGLCEGQSSGMKTWEKTTFGHSSDAEPCVFTIILIRMFPKPCVFAVVLTRFGLAVAQWVHAWVADFSRKACKKLGFGNMDKKKHVKTQGSAPGHRRNFVFYSIFLSVSKTPMEFWVVRAPRWAPPQPGPKSSNFIRWL